MNTDSIQRKDVRAQSSRQRDCQFKCAKGATEISSGLRLLRQLCEDGSLQAPPRVNSPKFVRPEWAEVNAKIQLDALRVMAKVMNALNQHWQKRNAAKKICPANSSQNGDVGPTHDAAVSHLTAS